MPTLHTALCDLLHIEIPIIQAPMAVATPALVAAVSNAGGLGMLGLANREPDVGFSPYGGSRGARCENRTRCWGELESEVTVSWWVKVRSKDGWEGWSDQPDHFGNKDACGEPEAQRRASRIALARIRLPS